jgi:hypothetical protein
MLRAALLVAVACCGRIAFDPRPDADVTDAADHIVALVQVACVDNTGTDIAIAVQRGVQTAVIT